MNNKTLIMPVIAALVMGVVGFLAGTTYQKSLISSQSRNALYMPGVVADQVGRLRAFRRRGVFAKATVGQIVSADANSITVKLKDGSTKIINIASFTQINKTQAATQKDLVAGQNVAVTGTVNSNGSITARSVQLGSEVGQGGTSASPNAAQ